MHIDSPCGLVFVGEPAHDPCENLIVCAESGVVLDARWHSNDFRSFKGPARSSSKDNFWWNMLHGSVCACSA